jgi:hypothetical protein
MKHAPQAIAGYWRWNHALDEFGRLYSKKMLATPALSLTRMQRCCGHSLHSPGKPHRQTFVPLAVEDWSWPAAQKFLILCEEHLIGTRPDLFQLLIEPI